MERVKLQMDVYKNIFEDMACTHARHADTCFANKIPGMPCINNIFSIDKDQLFTTLKKVLANERVCGSRNVIDKIVDINFDNLSKIFKLGFKNFIAMKSIECMFENKSFSSQLYKDVLSYISSEKFWLKRQETLGQGSYGIAATVFFERPDIKFVCKIPLRWSREDIEDTILEYFIGAVVINEFRRFCPNFCYTIGSFRSNASKEMRMEFTTERIFNFYEHIDGTDVSRISPEMCAVSIFQLGLALERAQRANRFFHSDMSTTNVMISKETKQFRINLDNKSFIFNSPVVSIIDYGMASATINGVRIGKLLSQPQGDPFRNVYNRPGFLLPGIDLFKYIVVLCVYGSDKTAEFARWIVSVIFQKLGVPDPYNINGTKRNELQRINATDYFGGYSVSRVASLSPQQMIEILITEKRFYDMVVPKYLKIEDISFNERSPSLYDFYRDIYKTPMKFDTTDCIENIKSYMQAYEIMEKITDNVEITEKLMRKMKDEKEAMIEYDRKILLKFNDIQIPDSRIHRSIEMATKCFRYNYKQKLSEEDIAFLINFMQESEFLDEIDKYVEIFMHILNLRIPEQLYADLYNHMFSSSKQFHICINVGPHIRAGRRWAVTLFEKDY